MRILLLLLILLLVLILPIPTILLRSHVDLARIIALTISDTAGVTHALKLDLLVLKTDPKRVLLIEIARIKLVRFKTRDDLRDMVLLFVLVGQWGKDGRRGRTTRHQSVPAVDAADDTVRGGSEA